MVNVHVIASNVKMDSAKTVPVKIVPAPVVIVKPGVI
jgi:hypothetical protein